MTEKIVKAFFILIVAGFVGTLVYKAVSPNDYKHPRAR